MASLSTLQQRISDAFATSVFVRQPAGLYEPIAYSLELGGKRLRPLLVLLSCDLFGGDPEQAINPAMGVEIFHNFTLLHDDIMDNALLRRGKETVFTKWNQNTAILSGDTMFVMAYEYVCQTDPSLLPEVLQLFNETARQVCEGQQFDMDFERQATVSIADYLMMIRLKTAVLIACSLKLGAILAKTDPSNARLIYDFGIEMGLAFQLQDDLLDVFGDPAKFGKAIGGDICTNKKTYLNLKAFELASGETLTRLKDYYTGDAFSGQMKIDAITRIYRELNIREITRHEIEIHLGKAMSILESLGYEPAKTMELTMLLHDMLGRER